MGVVGEGLDLDLFLDGVPTGLAQMIPGEDFEGAEEACETVAVWGGGYTALQTRPWRPRPNSRRMRKSVILVRRARRILLSGEFRLSLVSLRPVSWVLLTLTDTPLLLGKPPLTGLSHGPLKSVFCVFLTF